MQPFVHLFRIFVSSTAFEFKCGFCLHVIHGCLCMGLHLCAHVCLIALVTQAVSHTHCSKLWVGEGHCGADRGDRKARGDGGWAGENKTERVDNEKLKAARKWDVGLHSRAIAFTVKKAYISLGAWVSSTPLRFQLLISEKQRKEALKTTVISHYHRVLNIIAQRTLILWLF